MPSLIYHCCILFTNKELGTYNPNKVVITPKLYIHYNCPDYNATLFFILSTYASITATAVMLTTSRTEHSKSVK